MTPRRPPSPRLASVRLAPLLALFLLSLGTPDAAISAAQDPDLALPPGDSATGDDPAPAREQLSVLRRAREASAAAQYGRARSLWEQVVSANPYRSEAWLEVAEARARTGDMEGGFEALRLALEMGLPVPRGRVLFEAAGVLAAAGQERMAAEWLGRALDAGFGDRASLRTSPALAGLRGHPAFDSLVVEAPAGSRAEGWRRDIEYFVSEARRMHAAPGRPAHGERFAGLADSLEAAAASSDDDAMAAGLARLAASLGDGHTWIAPVPGDTSSPARIRAGFLPVRLYAFRDGIHVVDGEGAADRWIGARLTAVGGRDIRDVLEDLAPYVSRDNDMGLRSSGVDLYLRHTGFLRAVGAADSLGAATLTLADGGGTRRVTLSAGSHRFARALPVPTAAEDDPPRYLADPSKRYWMDPIPERAALYVQINAIRDRDGGPGLAAFSRSIRDSLTATGASGVVLDLRWNGGGNNGLLRPLIRQLLAWEVSGDDRTIVVLAGRHTFSAAQNLANRLERWTDAVFVGEPTGSRPNVAGEHTELVLPWSGLSASISNRYWQDSDPGDERPWIAPGVRVEPSSGDYFSGGDPVLEAALELLEAPRSEE